MIRPNELLHVHVFDTHGEMWCVDVPYARMADLLVLDEWAQAAYCLTSEGWERLHAIVGAMPTRIIPAGTFVVAVTGMIFAIPACRIEVLDASDAPGELS